MMMKRMMLGLLSMAMVTGAASAIAATAKPGQAAPDFELTLIDGSKITREDLRGQVVVLNFWATWCGPCLKELPLLDNYYRYQKRHGLRVFAIATEDSLPARKLQPLFAAMEIPSVRKIKGGFRILTGLPTNYVIDRAGTVRYAKAGAFDLDDLNTILVPLLQEPAPAAP